MPQWARIGMKSINYHGYTVMENGTILNKDGTVKKIKVNKKGYPFTNFYYEKKLRCHLIHTFIWRAFNGDIPKGFEVDHKDDDRSNFQLSNLQLLTKSDNNQKSYDSGNRSGFMGLSYIKENKCLIP